MCPPFFRGVLFCLSRMGDFLADTPVCPYGGCLDEIVVGRSVGDRKEYSASDEAIVYTPSLLNSYTPETIRERLTINEYQKRARLVI